MVYDKRTNNKREAQRLKLWLGPTQFKRKKRFFQQFSSQKIPNLAFQYASKTSQNPSNEGSDIYYDQYPKQHLDFSSRWGSPFFPRDLISLIYRVKLSPQLEQIYTTFPTLVSFLSLSLTFNDPLASKSLKSRRKVTAAIFRY